MAFVRKHLLLLAVVYFISLVMPMQEAQAQCAMCSLNAENSVKGENMQGKGLNNGILFLLAMPFLIGAGVGVLWYKKFRVVSK